jgi:molecular chaperone HscB
MQYYEALGLAPALALDPEDLKQRFYDRSRQWHPDRFVRAGYDERQKALDMTALLNDAFRTLRDPVARAEYFLKQNGFELSKDAPPELLEEVFELNMALEELRSGDESALPQLREAQDRFAAMRAQIDEGLAEMFVRHDAGGGMQTAGNKTLDEIRSALNRRRYISNLVREVEKELNVHLSN